MLDERGQDSPSSSDLECWNRPRYCFLRSQSFKLFWEKEVEHNGTYSASAYLMARKTYSKCGQRLQALFLFVFIRQPQIPSSVGVWGNGLECWCQRYHGWERNAYFRVPLSLQCLQISLVSLSAADMAPGTKFQGEYNSVQQHWQPQGRKNGRVMGWMGTISYYHSFKAADKSKNISAAESGKSWKEHGHWSLCCHGIRIRKHPPYKTVFCEFRTIRTVKRLKSYAKL